MDRKSRDRDGERRSSDRRMHRRAFLGAAIGTVVAGAGCTGPVPTTTGTTTDRTADGPPAPPLADVPDRVGLETVVDGLDLPLDLAVGQAGSLLYVAERGGLVRVLVDGDRRPAPALDLSSRISTGYEKGLLGIAAHPDFDANGRLFVRYSAPPGPETPTGYDHRFVLSEFRTGTDRTSIDPATERVLLTIQEPQSNHNAGSIVFGPEGHLYVGVGDGGGAGDRGRGHVEDWYDGGSGGNGQDVRANLLGSVLRIDVDDRDGDRPYGIPSDNPLVGRPGLDEHYAWGFRNPWRLTFDGETLFAGDVGQNRFEEVDRVVAGANYGWNVREGTHCYEAATCPDRMPEAVRGGEPLRPPVVEYPHEGPPVAGISVVVGNVYRGAAMPGLQGTFVFGDLNANGRLFVAAPRAEPNWPPAVLPVAGDDAENLARLYAVDRVRGEIYVLGRGRNGGGVHRVVPAE